jgi:hypothetical protein
MLPKHVQDAAEISYGQGSGLAEAKENDAEISGSVERTRGPAACGGMNGTYGILTLGTNNGLKWIPLRLVNDGYQTP